MRDAAWLLVVGAFALVGVLQWRFRRDAAQGTVERWLLRHRYRVRRLRLSVGGGPHFPLRLSRDGDAAFVYRAEVEDGHMGGSGVVWLRVWIGWAGTVLDDEPEVVWERFPKWETPEESPARSWETAQLALLRRVADGESTFRRSSSSLDASGEPFARVVEHLQALERRGLVTLRVPPLDPRRLDEGPEVVTDVALSPEGRRVMGRQPSA
ncbi:hypothetical protein [Roseisolibacter sp. H3M3-2]|uniref:hypothetical protein n=1 Tax=Roseisolibacter sp. H3M3-2 TaxID=3031323 RepID=UPI0023DB9FEA|nr:hypothetical protein [Roseisolibacter sp. H3M3-2]MDF1502578.1 hypothetical protein [Roseisolibacter sp. H3M3-2]